MSSVEAKSLGADSSAVFGVAGSSIFSVALVSMLQAMRKTVDHATMLFLGGFCVVSLRDLIFLGFSRRQVIVSSRHVNHGACLGKGRRLVGRKLVILFNGVGAILIVGRSKAVVVAVMLSGGIL